MFEKLCLEGAQSGLSWLTILRKREAYRKTFHNFDIDKVAAMTGDDVQAILDTPPGDKKTGNTHSVIVRHRGKIESVINNARCIQKMRTSTEYEIGDHGVFDTFLWSFVDNRPILNTRWDGRLSDAHGKSDESEAMSKALKKLGFKFVGPTTCYSMMQSEGLVIDHPVGSPEWTAAVKRLQERPGGYQELDKKM
jgi:DNA-3-methyladenine glycosylase I